MQVVETVRRRLPYSLPIGLLLVLAGLVRWHGQIPYPDALYGYDHYAYLALARQLIGSPDPYAHIAPFCWRLLTPLLAHALASLPLVSVSLPDAFWLLTVAGLCGATVGLMWFLRGLGLSRAQAVAGGITLVLLSPAIGANLWYYLLVDPLALALLTLALGASVRRMGPLLVGAIVLGTLDKEVMALAAVFAALWALERRDWRMLRWAGVAGVACMGILAALHLFITAHQPYSYVTEFAGVNIGPAPLAGAFPLRLLAATTGTWDVLLPLALLQLLHSPRAAHSYAFLALFLGATAQIAVSLDLERVVVYAFPVVIAACCWEVPQLAIRLRCSPWVVWALVWSLEVPGTWLFGFHNLLGHALLPFTQPTYEVETILLAAVTLALAWLMTRRTWAQRRKQRSHAVEQVGVG